MCKPTFNDVPLELLDEIFQHLPQRDLLQCQTVCRSWYLPAQLLMFKQVRLTDNSKVDSFLNTIADNRLCIRAVKQLTLGDEYNKGSINACHAERLLSCLQNVEDLTITGNTTFVNLVKDTASRELVIRLCRKLQKVKCVAWVEDAETYIGYLFKGLKNSLTYLDLMENDSIGLLSGFPRLQHLCFRESRIFVNFETWLPLFEQQYTLNSIHGVLTSSDRDNFMDTYIQIKSREAQKLLVDKLSNVKSLALEDKILCPDSIQFVSQYFTGVTDFKYVTRFFKTNWSDVQIRSFCDDLLDFTSALQGGCSIKVWNLGESTFPRLLPIVVQKMFYRLPSNFKYVERQLQISIFYNASAGIASLFSPVNLTIKSSKTSSTRATRLVDIRLGVNPAILHHIKEVISKLPDVDTLIFNLLINSPPTYLSIFQQILDRLPTLRKVVLYIHEYTKPPENKTRQYTHVQQMELNVGGDMQQSNGFDRSVVTFQDTFSRSVFMFPSIKYLKLHYFSGFWKEDKKLFEIPLQDMNLESLYLDVTPVLAKSYSNRVALENSYFVLCIQTNDQRHTYQVSLDYLGITKIDNDKTLPRDHTQVIISVASLKFIKLYLYKDILKDVDNKTYLQTNIENVVEARLPIV